MNFFTRLSNGWNISMNSFKVLKANKDLIVFPVISGCSMLIVMASFAIAMFAASDGKIERFYLSQPVAQYLWLFLFYLVNYFIIVFFNMALIHCTRSYFKGEEVNLRDGINFSLSRMGVIFSWAVFAATIGAILKVIQENSGIIGKIITGIIGIVWNIATFFVVPVIAYENAGPIDAFKRSSQIMKEKWGESLSGNFSFGLVQFIAILFIAVPLFFLGSLVNTFLGIALAALGAFIVIATISAAQTIFISAVYHNINGGTLRDFDQELVENLFIRK
jgi:hypothetical protein